MLLEERRAYLEDHPQTKSNGCYYRDLLILMGNSKGVQVPRSRDGRFHSELLPYRRRYSVELEELVRALIVAGVFSRKMGEVLDELYGKRLFHSTLARLSEVAEGEIENWRQRPFELRYAVVYLDAMFFPLKRNRVESEAIYLSLAIRGDGQRELLGYWLPGDSESALNWYDKLECTCIPTTL